MRVVCINNSELIIGNDIYGDCESSLTVGRSYDSKLEDDDTILIKNNDKGLSVWYKSCRFKPLSEIREEKLNELFAVTNCDRKS